MYSYDKPIVTINMSILNFKITNSDIADYSYKIEYELNVDEDPYQIGVR